MNRLAPWSASRARPRDHASRADVGLEWPDRRQRRLRLAGRGPRLSRACRRPETAGAAARGRRPDTSESGSPGVAALVHPACRLAAPDRPARNHRPPLQHRLEHRRPGRRQGLRQAALAALPRTHPPAAPPRRTAYDPQGPIAGAHANGYALAAAGTPTDTTARHLGKGADGAIVTDAEDEARFLTALTDGTLLDPRTLGELRAATPAAAADPPFTSAAAQATASSQTSSTPSTAAASPCSSSTARRPARPDTPVPQQRQAASTAPPNRIG